MIESGQVVNSAGHPVVGATVILFPYSAPLATKVPPGRHVIVIRHPANDNVPLTPLARAVTGKDGYYAIHLPLALRASLANRRSGSALNLHIVAFYPDGMGNWFVPLPQRQRSVTAVARMVLRRPTMEAAAASVRPDGVPSYCTGIGSITELSGIPVNMGYSWSYDPDVDGNARFVYSTTDSTTFGVAVSTSDDVGTASGSGTVSQSSSGTNTFAPIAGNQSVNYTGDGTYDWQEYQCYIMGEPYFYDWYATPAIVNGSEGDVQTTAANGTYCDPTTGQESWSMTTTTQETWEYGVDLEIWGFDINVESQDGYSVQAELTYAFDWQNDNYPPICGTKNYPGLDGDNYVGVRNA
jgi:hypothetical protein